MGRMTDHISLVAIYSKFQSGMCHSSYMLWLEKMTIVIYSWLQVFCIKWGWCWNGHLSTCSMTFTAMCAHLTLILTWWYFICLHFWLLHPPVHGWPYDLFLHHPWSMQDMYVDGSQNCVILLWIKMCQKCELKYIKNKHTRVWT